jgi:hypothetical protein
MLMASMLSTAETCKSEEDAGPESTGCFSNAPLENIPWAKDQLQVFQRPRSGPLQVSIYIYRGENFLVFANPSLSSPMSYIFDCSGASIGQRGINYNVFMDSAKEVAIILEGKY